MKYFKFDMWKNINDDDKSTRNCADEKWMESQIEYSRFIDSLLKNKPWFNSIFEQTIEFHDALIEKIQIEKPNIVKIHLSKHDKCWLVKYSDVTSFNMNSQNFEPEFSLYSGEEYCWGYDEFDFNNELITHNILTDCGIEFYIESQKIEILNQN